MKHYQKRNTRELDRYGNNYYSRHVEAMTAEGLHEKSDIAAELAYRDHTIDKLKSAVRTLLSLTNEECPSLLYRKFYDLSMEECEK